MNCHQCAETMREGALICDSCGSPVTISASSEATTASLSGVADIDALIGRVIGEKYQLISLLGKGGMGSVYRARRLHIGDEVALKVLHREYVNEPKTVERFRREAQAAAMLRHPAVVAIYDFSEARGDEPAYIVMELVEGRTLRRIIESEGALGSQRAVAIMREICKGVGAAHRLHMVHRDIKPDNIMVTPPDFGDQHEGIKVVDFGIAKLRDMAASHTLTQTGRVVGTVYYMSPEQCCAEHLDARSDVYSLGAVLYEMLAGTPPFTSETATAIVAKHLTQPPPPLRKELGVPIKLEALIMRALAKQPALRQSDATTLGKELGTITGAPKSENTVVGPDMYISGTLSTDQTKDVVPPPYPPKPLSDGSFEQKAVPFVPASSTPVFRQPWFVVGLIGLVAVSAIFVFAGKRWMNRGTSREENSKSLVSSSPSWQVKQTLKHDSKVYAIAFSPDDQLLATASSEGLSEDREFISELKLWNTATGELKRTITEHSEGVLSLAFSPDGRRIAASTGAGSAASKIGKVKLWDAQTGELRWAVNGHKDFATSVTFSPDGRMIASGSLDHIVKLWDAETGELLKTLPLDDKVYAVAFSPDGKMLATASQKTLQLWNVETGDLQRALPSSNYSVIAVAFSGDGKLIASGDIAGNVELREIQTGVLKNTFREHGDVVDSLAFSPDVKLLASGSYDSTVIIWDLQTSAQLTAISDTDKITAIAFSNNGRIFASGGWSKTVFLRGL